MSPGAAVVDKLITHLSSTTRQVTHFFRWGICNNRNAEANLKLNEDVKHPRSSHVRHAPGHEAAYPLKANTNADKPGRKRQRRRMCTEQVVPTQADDRGPRRAEPYCNLRKEVRDDDLDLRVLLLSGERPAVGADGPAPAECGRSSIELSSVFGSVTVEVIRLAGAAAHHFRLDVVAALTLLCQPNSEEIYPSIAVAREVRRSELKRCMEEGGARLNSAHAVSVDEDDVHIYAARRIELEMSAQAEEVRRGGQNVVWTLETVGKGQK